MTSCLLLKAPDRIVAVADGRLSVTDDVVSFDTVEKIRRFTPKYRIPYVSLGRFDHFGEYRENDWCISYAGTYALVSQIIDVFLKNIGGALVLARDRGTTRLQYHFDENGRFDGSYNFDPSEYPKITPQVLVSELRDATQLKCNEWSANRGSPDCEFLLFGKSAETKKYKAFKISPNFNEWRRDTPVALQVDEIADGVIASIGSREVARAAAGDIALRDGSEGWRQDQTELGLRGLPDLMGNPPLDKDDPGLPADRNWSAGRVQQKFIQHIRNSADPGVGGKLFAASGGWYGEIECECVPSG